MVLKKTRRQRDIKSKLLAAICMLLVSSIMMVSSTYAWFTLSTAPEVTGITTAVGANGNLEMALLPKGGPSVAITSGAGDSTKNVEARNITWGNLVDLKDTGVYGMDKITLYPAALNVGTDGKVSTVALLKTPTYGADGRVDSLIANTVTGYYNSTSSSFVQNDDYGVRAVGTASGMTDRQLDYRNAKAAANTAAAQAKNAASQSLNNNGSTLANIAIKYGTSGTDATFTKADIAPLNTIINDLLGTTDKTGALEYIETAYLQSILAYAASAATGTVDTTWSAIKGAVEAQGATLTSVQTTLTDNKVTLPDALTTAITAYEATVAKVKEAQTKMSVLMGDSTTEPIVWADVSPVLSLLADPDQMEVNDILARELLNGDNFSKLVSGLSQGGLVVTMKTGGGVYADIADQCGDYTASVTIEAVEYKGITLKNMTARMATATTQNPTYLNAIATAVAAAGAPASGDATDKPITDMYGYVIDLAFRTNAADSNLILQTTATDRIYSDNTNEETMGGGSTMTFASTTPDFSNNQVKALMKAIRVVFFQPEDGTIVATAKLDVDNATIGADGVTANLSLYIEAGTSEYSYTESENGTYKAVTDTTYALITDENYTGDRYNSDGTANADGDYMAVVKTTHEPIGEDETYEGTKYAQTVTVTTQEKLTDEVDIMPLTQGQQTALSVLVYLDGENVTNADVAATAATSMTGTMNLQFASSATLVPMEYASLHIADSTTTTTTATTTTSYTVTSPSIDGVTFGGAAKATANTDYTFTLTDANSADVSGNYTVTYTVDGGTAQTITATNGTYTIPASSVTGDITITATAN